jgi:hypothetical protein
VGKFCYQFFFVRGLLRCACITDHSAPKPIEIVSELRGVLTRVLFILIEDLYIST